ncbi:MAG: Ribosomal protein [Rickettsiaceae bacterium]|jgi:large subunit ribosomal protein L29|nr:Ribosomal protein [Rickettsiaceae bacterium]
MSKKTKVNNSTDLQNEIVEAKKELFKLRIQKSLGELKNTSLFSNLRKKIARAKTKINSLNAE